MTYLKRMSLIHVDFDYGLIQLPTGTEEPELYY